MNESVNERKKFLNWWQLFIVLKPFQYVHFNVRFTENLKNRKKQTKKVIDNLHGSDNPSVLMEFSPARVTWWLVGFLKALSSSPIFRCISCFFLFFFSSLLSFFAGDNASLFLFCNQCFINMAVNVSRLFQSSGCTIIYLIFPFCSMFCMFLMSDVVDVFPSESFFWCLRWFPQYDAPGAEGCTDMPAVEGKGSCGSSSWTSGTLFFLPYNLETSTRAESFGDESPIWPPSFDRGKNQSPSRGSEPHGHIAVAGLYSSPRSVADLPFWFSPLRKDPRGNLGQTCPFHRWRNQDPKWEASSLPLVSPIGASETGF